jgi:hypothetical protein
MSLLRLLTTGKSLVGVKDDESRYRLTSQRLLPHFGPAKNPFSTERSPDPVQTERRVTRDGGENGASGKQCNVPSSSGKPTAALRRGSNDRRVFGSARRHGFIEALRLRAAAVLSGWRTILCGSLGRLPGKATKPAIPQFMKQPVQGDLSLDKIKVVRNDLSDADLEVVTARQPTIPMNAAPGLQTGERAKVPADTWGRVKTRIFGAGKT